MTNNVSSDRLTAKQTADVLGFTTTNLKHYASLLEQNGHSIYRNTRNHREYTEHDVKLLRAMQALNRDKSMLLEDAASVVTSSDTDIDDILAPKLSPVTIEDTANIAVVPQGIANAESVLAQLSSLIDGNKALRAELQARDKLNIEFQADISDKMQKQAKVLEEQTVIIDAMRAELESIRKAAEEEKPSFWSRILRRR